MADTVLTKAEILVSVRDEARKILERIGPAGVKSLTDIQKKVEELDAAFTEQQKTVKTLQKAMDDQAKAATKAGDAATTAAKTSATAAKGATLATEAWSFAVKTLDRVWKGLKSALIIAPLLAITQELLSALISGAKDLLGFGDAAETAGSQLDQANEATKRLTDSLRAMQDINRGLTNNRLFGMGTSADEVRDLEVRLQQLTKLRDAIRQDTFGSKADLRAQLNAAIPDRYLPPGSTPRSSGATSAANQLDFPSSRGLKSDDALALVDDALARINARVDELQTKEIITPAQQAHVAKISDEAKLFADNLAKAKASDRQRQFTSDAGFSGGGAALFGLTTAEVQASGNQAISVNEILTRAMEARLGVTKELIESDGGLADAMARLAELSEQAAAAHQRDVNFEKTRLQLMGQLNLTTDEQIALRRDLFNQDVQAFTDMQAQGNLTKDQLEQLVALRERLYKQSPASNAAPGSSGGNGQPTTLSAEANVGVNALSASFSDIALNAQSATGAANQFFQSVVQGLVRVAAQKAALSIFDTIFGGGGGASQSSVVTVAAAKGGVFPGHFQAFADGGVASSPTLGLIAEDGVPEAVVPLPDHRSIPVTFPNGGGGGITIVVNATVQAIDRKDFEAHLDEHGKRIAKIVSAQMASHTGLRQSTRETVRGGR